MICLPLWVAAASVTLSDVASAQGGVWSTKTAKQWGLAHDSSEAVTVIGGQAQSTAPVSGFRSVVKRFPGKRQASHITFKQTTAWDNWQEVPNVGAPEMRDAPIFVPVGDGDYWLLARHADYGKKQFQAGGYHAWHSADMQTWTHHGPVSNYRSRWATTAEYVDGTFYIYYDHPNDQDPHLILDKDLTDGKIGKDMGMVFADPSHGSDCAIFRDDADGRFHLIYENWDPINARANAWDSPLAGHAVSDDGIHNYQSLTPVVDERTTPTGEFGEYKHSSSAQPLKYEIHQPEQNAYGDWTAIKVGGQYYLFCDYDPVDGHIRVGRWTSDRLNRQFDWCGSLGDGHPDPTIGFAEGRFYLIQQRSEVDFVSPGPWVGGVQARVGVDTSGDGQVNEWTNWAEVKESYAQKPGYMRVIETTPAGMDLASLPAGYGFCFEYRTQARDGQMVNVVMEEVEITFK